MRQTVVTSLMLTIAFVGVTGLAFMAGRDIGRDSTSPARTWVAPTGEMPGPTIDEIIGSGQEHLVIHVLGGSPPFDCVCLTFSSTPDDPRAQRHCVCTAPPVKGLSL